MWFLLFVILVMVLIAVSSSGKNTNNPTQETKDFLAIQEALKRRDVQWREYITTFRDRLTSKKEKSLLDDLLKGSLDQSSDNTATEEHQQPEPVAPSSDARHTLAQNYHATHATAEPAVTQPVETKPPIDNALLLLYLGAFLFVASAGLFVAFAGFSGGVRTLIVALVSGMFYVGGLYLFENKTKLKQAGVSFAAIGMAIAPLIGLSFYTYVLDGSAGAFVWFATSFAVMGLYLHAMLKLRSTFVSYLLIFSFVSMLQSTVSILDAPVYAFIWMLVVTGLVLRLVARYASSIDITELESSSRISAQLIIPVGIFVSLISVGAQGTFQLAITLFIAGFYYAVEGLEEANTENRLNLWQASHALFIAALTIAAYSIDTSVNHATISLLALAALHGFLLLRPIGLLKPLSSGLAANALAASLIALALSIAEPWLLFTSLLVISFLGLVLAFALKAIAGMFFAMIAMSLLPIIYGGYVLDPALPPQQLVLFSMLGPLFLLGLRWQLASRQQSSWLTATMPVVVFASLLPAFPALFIDSSVVSMFVFVSLALMYVYLGIFEQQKNWIIASGIFITGFVLHAVLQGVNPVLSLSILVAVLWNIALAVHYGKEVTRWIGSVLWFFFPMALLAPGWQTLDFSSSDISWIYIVTIAGFVLARAIARGVLFRSTAKPMQTFETLSSSSYVVGYYGAALTGFLFGLDADNVGLHISIFVALLIGVEYLRSVYVEKKPAIAASIPLLSQLLVLSLLSPSLSDNSALNIYLAWSMCVSAAMFVLHYLSLDSSVYKTREWNSVASAMLFIAPLSYLFIAETIIMMPIGLFVAGALMLYRNWYRPQDSRELTATLLVGALLWFMWYFDVSNLQAYTHVLAAVFAGYAYWRHTISDRERSDQYLQTMFLVATIPLALQAISGTSGDIYGWWLILEQVGFILLGMYLGRPFLIRWGLYVSVAAVLYQLRHLGWAALAVLAVFVIGLALHFLNRQDTTNGDS